MKSKFSARNLTCGALLGAVIVFAIATGATSCATRYATPPTALDESRAQESAVVKASEPFLRLNLATEDARPTQTKLEVRTDEIPVKVIKKIDDLPTGSADVSLSGIPDGKYFAYFSSPGYARQWRRLTVKEGKAATDTIGVTLFRKRYVVLRYAFNTNGDREFSGKDLKEGRAAVAHWGNLPYFQQDWQIWQKSSEDDLFGDTPYLEFHRFINGFGFASVPEGVSFEDLKEAPAPGVYKCRDTKAEKGLMLFCRIEGNRKEGLGYGKVVVEDVTETPPAGVQVIE